MNDITSFIKLLLCLLIIGFGLVVFLLIHQYQLVGKNVRLNQNDSLVKEKNLIKGQTENTRCDTIFEFGELMPKFVGGDKELLMYTYEEIVPIIGASNKRTGNLISKVHFLLTISKQGKVIKSEVLTAINKQLKEQLESALYDMPDWIPGTVKGKKECMKVRVPINCMKWE